MADAFLVPLLQTAGGAAHIVFTDRRDGDFRFDPADQADGREQRARVVAPYPWSWVRQVHGTHVVVVDTPGGGCGQDGDGLVTVAMGAVISVRGADCPVVALVAPEGVIGVAHAGWRGLVAGVLERTVSTMRACGATEVSAYLGPAISAGHYEFGEADLQTMVDRLGPEVAATTTGGRPALDLVAGVVEALRRVDVMTDVSHHRCTAVDQLLFSHRARGDVGRHAAAVWLAP